MQYTTLRHIVFGTLTVGALSISSAWAADYLTGYGGGYDVLHNDSSVELGVEYRGNEFSYHIRPVVGGFVNTDGGAYGYAGFNWDVPLANNIYLIPNFMVGAYHEGGSKDLGGTLEFRSGVELSYQMQNEHRVGIAFNHISNASIYDHDPGTESLIATYSVPIGYLFK